MLNGCYYRCPIPIEDGDRDHPRFFVLAQLKEFNKLSGAAEVVMYDLLGSHQYYGGLFKYTKFRESDLKRCAAISGGVVKSTYGFGTIVTQLINGAPDDPFVYYVKLQNGRYITADETELQIEYSQMNYSPLKQLEKYEFQNPSWFLNRLKVSRNLHIINNAPHGFRVLTGCRTLLLPHQISTVARCFEFSPIRYMIADEVGLGKTIEACSVLKIMSSENKQLRALIIVPASLITQWRSELRYKFNIQIELGSAKSDFCIIALEDLNTSRDIIASSWDIVIVDETHRLLMQTSWYKVILQLSRETQHLLLLSATPIQDRSEEYLRLLTLLNPDQYENMPIDKFLDLVRKQKNIQGIVNQQLLRMNRFNEYREVIIEKLVSVSSSLDDEAFHKMINLIGTSSEDKDLEIVSQALSYICENYRLERRVIRNRRQLIAQKMATRSLEVMGYAPSSADDLYNEIEVIQNILSYLAESCDGSEKYVTSVAIPLLGALFSSPWALMEKLQELEINDSNLTESTQIWLRQTQLEHKNADRALDEDPELIKGRLLWVLNYIDQEINLINDSQFKLVVFTGFNATLQEFEALFNRRYASQGVRAVSFGRHMSREALENSVYEFQNEESCRVIICDETGGEGRNFQNARLIIHLDIPWNVNALEQRIGRLDRLGRPENMDVLSVVVYAEGTIEEQLFHIWKDGMKLFEQSLSGLEIITGELNALIIDALLKDFYNGLTNAFDEIFERAEEMRESVEDEQLFDVGATLYQPLSQGIENVLNLYTHEENDLFASAMLGWARQAGMEAELPTKNGLIEFKKERFSSKASMQSLFIPPKWDTYSRAISRQEGRILGTFNRRLAGLHEDILFFAPGDSLYDTIILNAISCSRGRCCAFSVPGAFNYKGLVFIYNIEPYLDDLIALDMNPQVLSQFKMFLPLDQIIIPVPLTDESRRVSTKDVISLLTTINPASVTHMGSRGSSRFVSSAIEDFMNAYPQEEWSPLVANAEKYAYSCAETEMHNQMSLDVAQREMSRIINGYLAECLYFDKDSSIVEETRKAYKVALQALKAARPKLDSACFIKVGSR